MSTELCHDRSVLSRFVRTEQRGYNSNYMPLQDSDFVILKRERQTPSLAVCQRCKIKFFTRVN